MFCSRCKTHFFFILYSLHIDCQSLSTVLLIVYFFSPYILDRTNGDNVLGLDQFSQIILLVVAVFQQDIQSFIEPIIDSLNQFATIMTEVAPKIVAPLILLGTGLLVSRITQDKAIEENREAGGKSLSS
jgi:hypothetical protein